MKQKLMVLIVSALSILLALAASAGAMQYSLNLPLIGQCDVGQRKTVDIDFGCSFSIINSVTLTVTGYACPEVLYHDWSWCEDFPLEWGINFSDYGWDQTLFSQHAGSFSQTATTQDWSWEGLITGEDLLDGKCKATMKVTSYRDHPIGMLDYVTPGYIRLDSAVLTLDAVPEVPEPSSFLCLMAGIPGMFLIRRRR